MKSKAFLLSLAAVAGFTFSPAATEALAAPEDTSILSQDVLDAQKEKIASQIKFYDENGSEIQPYTLEELKNMISLSQEIPQRSSFSSLKSDSIMPAADYRVYNSTGFSFKYNYWIGGGLWGNAFLNPAQLFLTPSGTAKAFNVIARKDVNGSYAGDEAGRVSLPGGWVGEVHIPWSHLPRGKSYRFNLDNAADSSVTVYIQSATVWYD